MKFLFAASPPILFLFFIIFMGISEPVAGQSVPGARANPKDNGSWESVQSKFPQPVFDREPGFVDLYWKALSLSYAHVLNQPGLPQSRYMDEAFHEKKLWIWDTCFMSLYCRYAPDVLPGIESLSNFYVPIHDGVALQVDGVQLGKPDFNLLIQHPDNPPLFAWVEWQYFQMTGDKARVKWLLQDKKYLQKHYEWFNNLKRGERFNWSAMAVKIRPQPLGFQWGGLASGMDNSPRFWGNDIHALDALAQQGLAAKYISQLAGVIGDEDLAGQYRKEFERIRELVNKHYWDQANGFYFDLMADGKTLTQVCTPASFWPVLAGMASPEQVGRMVSRVRDPNQLGGTVPWVSLSRSDKDFEPVSGEYWRGALWLPTAYMGIRSLTENGQQELADETAEAVLRHMLRTYQEFKPQTIWECYSPSDPSPSTHRDKRVRPDFCGWSALGPVSLFIENVIGIHTVNASERTVEWRIHQSGRHGIRNLRFGDVTTDLIADGNGQVRVSSNAAYTLVIDRKPLSIQKGEQTFVLPR